MTLLIDAILLKEKAQTRVISNMLIRTDMIK